MTVVVTFENVQPPDRFDSVAWEEVRIEESATEDGTYAALETQTLSPVDAEPENPASRGITTALGTDVEFWYQLIFIDGDGAESAPTVPLQNTSDGSSYATIDELARILKIRSPSEDQEVALQRVLTAATLEINSEIDLDDDTELTAAQTTLATQVCLERASELWKFQEVQFGVVSSDFGSVHIARNTWEKHAFTLAPLKGQWGLA